MSKENETPVLTAEAIEKAVQDGMTKAITALTAQAKGGDGGNNDGSGGSGDKRFTPADLLKAAAGGGGGTTDVRVKGVAERFSTSPRVYKHYKTGAPVFNPMGREPASSEFQLAKAGAYLRTLASKAGLPCQLTELDKSLMESLYGDQFLQVVGQDDASVCKEISGMELKTLLSDSISGGSSANPIWFDEMLVSFPLLSGELYPYVNVVNMPRGNVADTASVANPTVHWGTSEGTEMAMFDTSSMVGAISTSVMNVSVAIEIGRDLLADSPVNLASYVTQNCGEKIAAELDRVIAKGNGTSEISGMTVASGTTTVHSAGGNTVVNTLGDWETLMFALAKQYRQPSCRFLSNDTTFARSRAIRVDPSASGYINQLPVMAPVNDLKNYSTLGWPHSIQNDMANTDAIFFNPAKYRLYRRQGFEFTFYRDGAELARRNTMLLVVRGRFGGQPVDGAGIAFAHDFKS